MKSRGKSRKNREKNMKNDGKSMKKRLFPRCFEAFSVAETGPETCPRGHEKESSVGIPSVYPGGYAYYGRGTSSC